MLGMTIAMRVIDAVVDRYPRILPSYSCVIGKSSQVALAFPLILRMHFSHCFPFGWITACFLPANRIMETVGLRHQKGLE